MLSLIYDVVLIVSLENVINVSRTACRLIYIISRAMCGDLHVTEKRFTPCTHGAHPQEKRVHTMYTSPEVGIQCGDEEKHFVDALSSLFLFLLPELFY